MNPNCTERAQSTVAPQALHLLNDATIRRLASALARRVVTEAGDSLEAQVERIFTGRCSAGRPLLKSGG